jgi:YfiH family protein
MTTLFEHAALAAPGVVRHGFLGRRGGVSNGLYESLNCGYGSDDDAPAVRENRAQAAAAFGRSADDLCTAHQVHGDVAIRVETAWPHGEAPRADGLVSNTPGVVLGILTADCAPVLLADGDNRVIGAFHAGWRGALGGIVESSVRAMLALGANVSAIRAVIGPCIGPNSYEVGAEFPAPFLAHDPAAELYFRPAPRHGHFLFDLPGYVAHRLNRQALGEVAALGRDTYAEEADFFSYRRNSRNGQRDYGRLLSAITLEA